MWGSYWINPLYDTVCVWRQRERERERGQQSGDGHVMLSTLGRQEWGTPTSCTSVRIQTPEILTSNLSQPESGRLRWWLKFPSPHPPICPNSAPHASKNPRAGLGMECTIEVCISRRNWAEVLGIVESSSFSERGQESGDGHGEGPKLKHHLSHTDSVRLRLLLKIRFGHFLGEGGATGGLNVFLGSTPLPI